MREAVKIAATKYPLSILLGVVIGVLFSPLSFGLTDILMTPFDRVYPVVEMKGVLIARTGSSVDVRMAGTKNRDCNYIGLQAYAYRGGAQHDLNIQRVDVVEKGDTKQPGVYDIGIWRMWPTDGATKVTVMVQHICAGRLVTTKIAEVAL